MLVSAVRPRPGHLLAWAASSAVATAGFGQGAPGAPTPAASPVTAFIDVTVIPMDTDRVLAGQTVVVRDGRIAALGPAAKVAVPRGAVRIDGQGKYLLPGLADMHTHIAFAGAEDAERLLFLLLANGITTIRNADYDAPGTPQLFKDSGMRLTGPELLRLKARAATGELWSPRIYTSAAWHLDSSKSVLENVAAYKAAGYDFIKIRPESREMAVDSLIPAAKRVGIPFGGHIEVLDLTGEGGEGRAEALQLGYHVIDHFGGFPDTWQGPPTDTAGLRQDSVRIAELAAATAAAGVWDAVGAPARGSTPTPLERRYGVAEWELLHGMRPDSQVIAMIEQKREDTLPSHARHAYRLLRALQDAGAGLLVGTDMPVFGFTGFEVPRQLQALVQWAGLTPYQALVAATRNPAAALGALDSAGTVAVGKRADLVLLTGNPLVDIRHTGDIGGVMVAGRWLSRAEIERRLDAYYPHMIRSGRD